MGGLVEISVFVGLTMLALVLFTGWVFFAVLHALWRGVEFLIGAPHLHRSPVAADARASAAARSIRWKRISVGGVAPLHPAGSFPLVDGWPHRMSTFAPTQWTLEPADQPDALSGAVMQTLQPAGHARPCLGAGDDVCAGHPVLRNSSADLLADALREFRGR